MSSEEQGNVVEGGAGPPDRPLGRPVRMVVLVSGSGSTLQNLIDRIEAGRLSAEIPLVVADRPGAGALQRARRHGVPTEVVAPGAFGDPVRFSRAQWERMAPYRPDLVVMAGYLRRWLFPPFLRGRVMNVHPSLLPAFGGKGHYGLHVHRAVLEAGCKVTGCTVHFCTDEYDDGPIILQAPVPVLDDDTPERLAARVQAAERELLPRAITLFAEGRLRVEGRRVRTVGPPAPGFGLTEPATGGTGCGSSTNWPACPASSRDVRPDRSPAGDPGA